MSAATAHHPLHPTTQILTALALSTALTCHADTLDKQSVRSLKEIRQQGLVMQKWENSCAAASIATVLTYGFRHPVTERYAAEKMLEKTDSQRVRMQGGFSLLDLKQFVESQGFAGNAYKNLDFDDLQILHAPIVPIDMKGYNHYVVFNGVAGDRVQLADPAFGHRTLAVSDFKQIWMNGMAFIVTRLDTQNED